MVRATRWENGMPIRVVSSLRSVRASPSNAFRCVYSAKGQIAALAGDSQQALLKGD